MAIRTRTGKAMGQTRRFAERMNRAGMTPQPRLASAGYCLARVGAEYLVYQANSGEAFSVNLPAGTYQYEWFNPQQGATASDGSLGAQTGDSRFRAPFDGDGVLYLKAADRPAR